MTTNDENIHLGELIKKIFSYWKIYVPIGLICLVVALVFLMITPKEYKMTARIQLLGDSQGMMSELKMLKGAGIGGLFGGGSSGVNTEDEIMLMQSRTNMIEVIKNTDMQIVTTTRSGLKKIVLDSEQSPITFVFPSHFLDTLSQDITVKLNVENGVIKKMEWKSSLFETVEFKNQSLPCTLQLPVGDIQLLSNLPLNGKFTITLMPLQYTFEELVKTLMIVPTETISDIILLIQQSSNKYRSAKLLNAIMDQYNLYSRDVKLKDANLNAAFVRNRLDTVTMELAMLEHQIEQYKQTNKMPNPEAYATVTYYGNKETEKLILETETKMRMLSYVVDYLENPSNEFSAVPVIDGAGEAAIMMYNQLLLERQRLMQSSEANNPALLLVEKQLREQHKMLLESVKSVRNNLKISLEALYKKDNTLAKQVDNLPKQEREFIEMKRQQRIKESIYLFLMQKLQEKELINSPDEVAGRIIDSAYSSYKHVFPRGSIILAIAFVVASMLSLIIICLQIFVFNKKE